jgi:hypothetical protein
MGGLDTLLTSEMDSEQWSAFRESWIKEMTHDLHVECGVVKEDCALVAELQFEEYVGQEGYTGRDELISLKRGGW